MLHVTVKPPAEMRYVTVGDWQQINGELVITVADSGSRRTNFLVALHEIVEAFLCEGAGITAERVDAFDLTWKEHDGIDEPGDDPLAPYHYQHEIASSVERVMAAILRVRWVPYLDRLDRTEAAVAAAKGETDG